MTIDENTTNDETNDTGTTGPIDGESGASESETVWNDAAIGAESDISEELATIEQVVGEEMVVWDDPADDDLDAEIPPPVPDDPEIDPDAIEETSPEEIRSSVLADVKEFFAAADADEDFAPFPTDEFVDEQWFDFDYLDGFAELERKWVNEPYAYVSVLYDDDRKELRYHVTEPVLDDFEEYVREDLTRILRDSLLYQDLEDEKDRKTLFDQEARAIIADHARNVDGGSLYKLLYYLTRDFVDYGQIDPAMRDTAIEDISCDGVEVPVFVYHREYRDLKTNVSFRKSALDSFTVRLAQKSGKSISVSNPLVDASLPDGSRIQLTLGGEISTRGSNFTIRKFSDVPYTPVDLINWNTFSVEEMAYFWLAIENNRSLIFAGGTGSGKTTSLNAVSFFVPPNSKVVSIEDTREITLPHDNWIQSVTRSAITEGGRGQVDMYQLLQSALRQRPEYLLVGEIRTEARVALTFFQAIGTGHTAYTTIHADSIEGVMARLQNDPLDIPAQMIKNLDIVSIQRQIRTEETRVRRNQEIVEILPGGEGEEVLTRTVFKRDPRTDTHEQLANSHALVEIAEDRGWDEDRIADELALREEVLQYLVDEDISSYGDVTALIHTFNKDPDYVVERIRSGELGVENLEADDADGDVDADGDALRSDVRTETDLDEAIDADEGADDDGDGDLAAADDDLVADDDREGGDLESEADVDGDETGADTGVDADTDVDGDETGAEVDADHDEMGMEMDADAGHDDAEADEGHSEAESADGVDAVGTDGEGDAEAIAETGDVFESTAVAEEPEPVDDAHDDGVDDDPVADVVEEAEAAEDSDGSDHADDPEGDESDDLAAEVEADAVEEVGDDDATEVDADASGADPADATDADTADEVGGDDEESIEDDDEATTSPERDDEDEAEK